MTNREIVLLVASIITSGGLSAVVVAIINWRQLGPKTKAETAKAAAETREIDVDTQDKLIGQVARLVERQEEQDTRIADLERTIRDQGAQIETLQRRNRDLGAAMRSAVSELLGWIRRARAVMTPDQQLKVGAPPDYEHLVTVPDTR